MDLAEPMKIDGRSYSKAELLDFCHEVDQDPNVPDWKREVYSFVNLFLDPVQDEIRQKSSGTTGDPREYQLVRESMIRSAQVTLKYFRLQSGDRALLCLPIRYIAGKMMVVRALVGGLELILAEPSGRPLETLESGMESIALGAMVPLQVHDSIESGDDLSSIEKLIIGGGELHPSVREKLTRMATPAIYESFAMTETYTHFALKRINGAQPDSAFRLLEQVKIRKDSRGCLVVDMAGITRGEVITNDLVEIIPGGNGFKWLGRYDNVINTGGVKIIPEVLEEKIQELVGHHCLLLPETDVKLGDRLVLMIEYTGRDRPEEKWTRLLEERLPPYEVPKRIVVVNQLPRNSAFKPDRIDARKRLLHL